MAKIEKSILGGFVGKLGNVVGFRRNGKFFVRSLSGPRTKEPTVAQEIQMAKFKLMVRFLSSIKALLNFSFTDPKKKGTGYTVAFKLNYSKVVKGIYPDLYLDYSVIQVTQGTLPRALPVRVVSTEPGKIEFTWRVDFVDERRSFEDRAVLVVYCPDLNQSIFTTMGPERIIGAATLGVGEFAGKEVHAWLAFTSPNRRQLSASEYVGSIKVMDKQLID